MHRWSPKIVGFFQACALFGYVLLFAFIAFNFANMLSSLNFTSPLVHISVFLLAFIASALICGSIVFGYPIVLILRGEKSRAIQIVLSSIAWFVLLGTLFLLGIVGLNDGAI